MVDVAKRTSAAEAVPLRLKMGSLWSGLKLRAAVCCSAAEFLPRPVKPCARTRSIQRERLFVLEGGYGVEAGGGVGGQGAEDDADQDRGGERCERTEPGDGDLDVGEDADADGDGEADDGADEAAGEREEDGFGEELQADFAAGGAEGLADADFLDARLNVGEHGVHDADAGDDERDGGGQQEDDGEHVGDLAGGVEDVGERLGLVHAGGIVAAVDDLGDAFGAGLDLVRG